MPSEGDMNTNSKFVEDSSIIVILSDSDTEVNRYPSAAPTANFPPTSNSVKGRREPLQRVLGEDPSSHDSPSVNEETDEIDESDQGDENHGSEKEVQHNYNLRNKRKMSLKGSRQHSSSAEPGRLHSTPNIAVPAGRESASPCPPGRARLVGGARGGKLKGESSEEVKKGIENPDDDVDPDETEEEDWSKDPIMKYLSGGCTSVNRKGMHET